MTTPIVHGISDDELAELEELCGKATQGKWWIDSHGVTMMAMDSLEVVFTTPCDPKTAVRHPETGNLSNWRNDWDASYIATACPSKVQGLIARLRAVEADARRYRWLRGKAGVEKMYGDYTVFLPCGNYSGLDEAATDRSIDEAIAAMERTP